jgi:hypothetical protein
MGIQNGLDAIQEKLNELDNRVLGAERMARTRARVAGPTAMHDRLVQVCTLVIVGASAQWTGWFFDVVRTDGHGVRWDPSQYLILSAGTIASMVIGRLTRWWFAPVLIACGIAGGALTALSDEAWTWVLATAVVVVPPTLMLARLVKAREAAAHSSSESARTP